MRDYSFKSVNLAPTEDEGEVQTCAGFVCVLARACDSHRIYEFVICWLPEIVVVVLQWVFRAADPAQRSFYFWTPGYGMHIIPPTGQDTSNQPMTPVHFKSLSAGLRAGANPAVFTTQLAQQLDGLFAAFPGPRVGRYIYMMCSHLDFHQWASGQLYCAVSHVHLRRYEGLSPVCCSKSSYCCWQIWLFQRKIILVKD